MSRSSWKGPYIQKSYLNMVGTRKLKQQWSAHPRFQKHAMRQSTILPQFYRQFFMIHTGTKYVKFRVREKHIGHKFGDFVSTRKRCVFKSKKGKKK